MEDVNISKFRAQVVRSGSTPASPGFVVSEGQNPVDPSGSGQNHLPVTIATAATGLSITESQVLGGAGTVGQYIRGDGSLADFPATTGGGSSVSYYLNGSVSQGTIGGVAYKELNRTPVFGAGTDISINADGYIASFITDALDPNKLLIPAGNWNFETYFSASSSGGSPSFYIELYKYNGTTFTLIASSSSAPELIAFGTNLNPYFSTLAVPETVLALTDRLAVRFYVTHSGRTITLHTENNHLCQVITTFTTGLTALNGLTSQVQFFAVGTSGTDFAISSASDTHTFNLPTASATNRGALSSADWTTFNNKQNALTNPVTGTGVSGRVAYWNGTNSITSDADLLFDGSNLTVGGNFLVGSTQIIGINTADASDTGYLAICGASSDGPDRAGHIYLSGNERGTDAGSVVIAGGNTTTGTGATAAIVFRTLGTNKARLTSAGNFGIGTDTPVTFGTRNLDVNGGAGSAYIVARGSNNTGTIEMAFDGSGYIGTKTVHDLVIRTSDIQRINVFATSGNVLVGTGSDAGFKLDVNGTGRFSGALSVNNSNINISNSFNLASRNAANTLNIALIGRNSADRVVIDPDGYGTNIGGGGTVLINPTGGNVGIGTSIPSEQLNLMGANAYTSKIRFSFGASFPSYYANLGYNSDGNKVYLQIADGGSPSNIMTWNYTGNVGIGTAGGINVVSGWTNFVVNGSTTGLIGVKANEVDYGAIYASTGGNNFVIQAYGSSNAGNMLFLTASSVRLTINSTGFVSAGAITNGRLGVRGFTNDSSGYSFEAANASGNTLFIVRNDGVSTFTGNVGIGTFSPVNIGGYTALTLNNSTTGGILTFQQNGVNKGSIYNDGSSNMYFGNNSGNTVFETGGSPRITITSGGNVLIGTGTDGGYKLDVAGKARVNNSDGFFLQSGSQFRQMYFDGFSTLYFWNGSNQANLSSAGAWVNASDITIKKEITEIKYTLSDLLKLKPKSYKMVNNDLNQIGFIAQEVENIIPELVSTDTKGMKSLNYGNMNALIVKAIKELKQEIDTLKN